MNIIVLYGQMMILVLNVPTLEEFQIINQITTVPQERFIEFENFRAFIIEPKQTFTKSSEEEKFKLPELKQKSSTYEKIDFPILQSDYGTRTSLLVGS